MPRKHVRDILDELIGGRFRVTLKDLGYRKSGHTWRLVEPERVRIVNVQSSPWNTPGSGQFTINLGIYDYVFQKAARAVTRGAWKGPPKGKLPLTNHCCLRKRIGELMKLPGKQVDYWWTITQKTDAKELEVELVKLLHSRALPWLERAAVDYEYGAGKWLFPGGAMEAVLKKLRSRR